MLSHLNSSKSHGNLVTMCAHYRHELHSRVSSRLDTRQHVPRKLKVAEGMQSKAAAKSRGREAPVNFALLAAHADMRFVDSHRQGAGGARVRELVGRFGSPMNGFIGGEGGGLWMRRSAAASPSAEIVSRDNSWSS
jgi:hypothetical protein